MPPEKNYITSLTMIRLFLASCILLLTTASIVAQDKPLPPLEAAATMAASRVLGDAVCRRAGHRAADRVHVRRPRPGVGGRVPVVSDLEERTARGSDRVTILEDTDGDGRHDKRTVFYDKGVNLSGIEVGFGGVWLTAVPNLLFIPDANGDDKPDGPPEVLLDGWDLAAKHNVVDNLAWGPDGWLYGCNGILSNSRVGKPGTPDERPRGDELRRLALSSDAARRSRPTPTARPTRGASTGTSTARCSSPTA